MQGKRKLIASVTAEPQAQFIGIARRRVSFLLFRNSTFLVAVWVTCFLCDHGLDDDQKLSPGGEGECANDQWTTAVSLGGCVGHWTCMINGVLSFCEVDLISK